MAGAKKGVVLVGHGGIPTDCPRELVTKLKRLEAQRRATSMPPSPEELELNRTIRRWPRTEANDPYRNGLEAIAARLQPKLNGLLFAVAYNEFCAPTLEEAVQDLITQGAVEITVTTTMLTPGGSHSEIEIPEVLAQLRHRHPGIELRYAWPFDMDVIVETLLNQVKRFSSPSSGAQNL